MKKQSNDTVHIFYVRDSHKERFKRYLARECNHRVRMSSEMSPRLDDDSNRDMD